MEEKKIPPFGSDPQSPVRSQLKNFIIKDS